MSSGLEKATLTKLSNDRRDIEEGPPIPVQFNPASLKLTISNNTEGGQSTGRSQRQFTGNSSTELAFDLVFDTADEDDGNGSPVSVRRKTAAIEQFVLTQGSGKERKAPPRVKFHWGEMVVKGVITSVALDFDLFAANGTPLRAKMGISIKEQDARYELLQSGPGSSAEGGAPPPGGGNSAGPGTKGVGAGDPRANRSALALAGESAADFAARVGLEAAAWRGVAAGLEGTLSLSAGVEIDFNTSLGVSAGIGMNVGVEADLGLSLEASLGLDASAKLSPGASAGASGSLAAGFALSAAGGVCAAVEMVKIAKAGAAAEAAVHAFAAPVTKTAAAMVTSVTGAHASTTVSRQAGVPTKVTRGPGPSPGGTSASGPTGRSGGSAGASEARGTQDPTPRAYTPPRADARAATFGFGIPLRPRVIGAAEVSRGVVALRPYGPARVAPATRDPTTPPWMQLPQRVAPPEDAGGSGGPAGKPGRVVQGSVPYPARPAQAPGIGPPSTRTPNNPCGCGGRGRGR